MRSVTPFLPSRRRRRRNQSIALVLSCSFSALVCSRLSPLASRSTCLLLLARRMANQWWPSNQSLTWALPPLQYSTVCRRPIWREQNSLVSCHSALRTVSFTPSSSYATATVTVRFQRIHSILSAIFISNLLLSSVTAIIASLTNTLLSAKRFAFLHLGPLLGIFDLTAARDHLPH